MTSLEPTLDRDAVRQQMAAVLAAQGAELPAGDDVDLAAIGFRSLDFSELALRVEDETGRELNFEAAGLRRITTVGDVLDLITDLLADG